MVSFTDARAKVIEVVSGLKFAPQQEIVELREALGGVLAEQVRADRDYPPFDRSTRDGYAVRAADCGQIPATLEIAGQAQAGDDTSGMCVEAGKAINIMTGAAVPAGGDAVVMVEHAQVAGKRMTLNRAVERGQNIVARGSEAKARQALLQPGARLGYAEMAICAQVGYAKVKVNRKPRVAVLSTGNEVVEAGEQPGPFQIRNSNNYSIAAQVTLAGGEPIPLGNTPDEKRELRKRIERGLREDMLVLSGGVSMGKYDLVEDVLRELGAEFFFDAVAIRPGKPAVFGVCGGKPVLGLPGNPVSTMVTFELFGVPAVDLLSGAAARELPLLKAKLARGVQHKAGLTHFVPARLAWPGGEATVEELPWQGSGDIVALAQANCFLVVHAAKLSHVAGEIVDVLARRGAI